MSATGIACSNRVVARNGFGQFIRDCEQAAELTAKDAVERGAELSRGFAPVGHKPDPRTVKLKNSIHTRMFSRTSGEWYSEARHALSQEKGAKAHDIPGEVSFFWEKMDRMWTPGSNVINHPGNAAQPFLRPAYKQVSRELSAIARRHYP
jgi:hypothetical protein